MKPPHDEAPFFMFAVLTGLVSMLIPGIIFALLSLCRSCS